MPSLPQSSPRRPSAPTAADPAVQEVRIAMALNGGVSLAVWMGGCAVELDRARRANTAAGEVPRAYDALCMCFGRRLVIDILTGASAGGINGALLSAAMVKGRRLEVGFVRERWLKLGDLSKILYPATKDDPPSLMDGKEFYDVLLDTFKGVLGVPGAKGYEACEPPTSIREFVPSLDVTMTDVFGVEKRFRDAWGAELVAREHRPRFKFREAPHFSAAALAAAARTSASFPVAFEPWRVDGNPRVLADLPNPTYGIDGGLLDNAPIEAALELIPSKPSTSRVLRYICYLNGDPPLASDEVAAGAPTLRDVGGYTISLPRAAPFVDQLYAIQRAVERPRLAAKIQLKLLTMDIDQLLGTAEALFDTYAERRTTQSLEELLGEPGAAASISELVQGTEGQLPWIPFGLNERNWRSWRWGIRPAQRILHLLLDLLRPEIPGTSGELRQDLLRARATIDEQLTILGEARARVINPESEYDPATFTREEPLDRLQKAVATANARSQEALEAVVTAANAFRAVVGDHPDHFGERTATQLFGRQAPDGEDWLREFFRRVLSIEVVRRAFASEVDIDSAEELRFVQLTPAAPSPIFTAGPLRLPSPASAEEKLTGVGFGHFAGFYRRSWRANDFMWGRLDAAARIVDLLLDRLSDEVGIGVDASAEERARVRSAFLAKILLPASPPERGPSLQARRWLLEEALDDAATSDMEGSRPDSDDEVRGRVEAAIKAELLAATPETGVNRLPFTRAVFQRAAQLEIAEEELPIVRRETAGDRKLGSAVELIEPDREEDDVEREVKMVRGLYEDGRSLPSRLTDDEEAVSDLGLRTISHAAFVSLSAVRTAGAPLSKFFGIVRAPLSAVAATVAESRIYRLTLGLAFWTAAIFLTSRLVTANAKAPLVFSEVWSWATLTALVAALVVLGLAAVPALRATRGVHPLRNVLTAAGLLGTAGGVAVALAAAVASFDLERILFAPDSELPPKWAILAPLVFLGLVSVFRLPIPGWLSKVATKLERVRNSKVLSLLAVLAVAPLGTYAGADLWNAGFDGGAFWQSLSAALAFAIAPIVATISLARWRRIRLSR
jgi:predicted acylesterase/phospholipase RssA